MEDFVRASLLYDFYGELLTEHQKKVYSTYIQDDLSLTEIANEEGISRQGVYDMTKRCRAILEEYEDKLHLVERFLKIREIAKRIEQTGNIDEARALSKDIMELL